MTVIRSIVFDILFYAVSIIVAITYLPFLALPRNALWAGTRMWLRIVRFLCNHVLGLTYRVERQGRLPDGACVIVSKHQSAWETMLMLLIFDRPAMVMKQELLSIPFFGWYFRKLRMIPIDRSGGATALRTIIKGAKAAVADGRPILIYPEGTRTIPGDAPPLKRGFAGLYGQLKLPIVPVTLNSGNFWPRKALIKQSGEIVVRIMPPIDPGLPRDEVLELIWQRINGHDNRPGKGDA